MSTRSAVTLLSAVVITGLMLSLTGCIQTEHDLRINENGSASYRLSYAITEQAISQFRAMFKLKNDLAIAAGEPPPGSEMNPLLYAFLDPNEADIRKQIEACSPAGIIIKSIKQETRASWRHIELNLEIDDLAKLADNPFFTEYGFDLSKDKEGHFVFSRAPFTDVPGNISTPPSDRDLEQLTPLLAGFKTVVKITTPGRILSTTAFRTTLQTAVWEFDFNRQSTAVQALEHQRFHIVFDAPQAKLPELHTRPATAVPPQS